MKPFLLFLCAMTFALTSCSNDENSSPEDSSSEDNSVLPKTISYTYPDVFLGTNTIATNTYNGNKIVSSIENDSKTIFTYDGNVIIKQEQFDIDELGKETKNAEVDYRYENGKLKTRIFKEDINSAYPEGQYIQKNVYTHSSNLISYISYRVDKDTKAEVKNSEGTLTYRGGNLVKEMQIAGSLTRTRTYEYDTKYNPLKNILGFDLLLNEISEFGKNNVVKTTSISSDFATPANYITTYIYNDKGYPTKQTSLSGGGSVEYEIEYTY
jgi:hypothetical protein